MFSTANRRQTPLAVLLATATLVISATLAMAGDAPGNNGTVKVHSGGETEPTVDVRNEPHVTCPWHAHFFFGDAGQTGSWWVTNEAGVAVAGGTYTSDANGEVRTAAQTVGPGHFTMSWQGSTETLMKTKVFWVDTACETPGG